MNNTPDSASKAPAESEKKVQRYKNTLQMEEGHYPFHAGEGDLGSHRSKSQRVNKELGKYSLTEKQATILNFVSTHIETVGFPPTVREIAVYFNISAKAAHDHLRAIAKKGYLRLFPGSARGLELVKTGAEEESPLPVNEVLQDILLVPLLGTIAAGTPILAQENVESRLAFPRTFLPDTGNLFALRVKGDSMEGAGIFDGDIAVLEKVEDYQQQVKNSDIVAALIDGEATLKTFIRSRNQTELRPENSRYQSILLKEADNASIIGKLVGIYRKYR